MINVKEQIVSKYEVESKTCDICGKTYTKENNDILEFQEFLEIRFNGGYGSVFGDMMLVECDICQHCLKTMLGDKVRTKQYDI